MSLIFFSPLSHASVCCFLFLVVSAKVPVLMGHHLFSKPSERQLGLTSPPNQWELALSFDFPVGEIKGKHEEGDGKRLTEPAAPL